MRPWWSSSVSSKPSAIGWVYASKISPEVLNWAQILHRRKWPIIAKWGETTSRQSQARQRNSSAKPAYWALLARVRSTDTERPRNTSFTKARCRKCDWSKQLNKKRWKMRQSARFWCIPSSLYKIRKTNYWQQNLQATKKRAKTRNWTHF